jgi:hypothetical protein
MKSHSAQQGQAVIVLVMVVTIVSLIFTHVALLNINALKLSNELFDGILLRTKAEGYLESAAMRFLRDVNYPGETLIESDISCTIEVTDLGGLNRDFESTCERNLRSRTVGMSVSLTSGIFTFTKITDR